MGKVISLKPYMPAMPTTWPERAPRKVPLGVTVKIACDELRDTEPRFLQFLEAINGETAITKRRAFDTHHAVQMVIEHLKANGTMSIAVEDAGRVADIITAWRGENGISLKTRLAAAREQLMLAAKAAE
jgi:hypothetical protein